jgi:hypothetical protein
MQSAYHFYSDPGHGWLVVRRSELERLGLLGSISSFSYQDGDKVYLEEDCDAEVFFDAKDKLGEASNVIASYTNEDSEIRGYDCFHQ